jgi:hypothetical protein
MLGRIKDRNAFRDMDISVFESKKHRETQYSSLSKVEMRK